MSFPFLFAGLLLLVSGVRGTQDDLFALVHDDFVGQGNFLYWSAAVISLGLIGYYAPLRGISRAFLVLIVLVLILTKGNPKNAGGGLFAQLTQAINRTASAAPVSQSTGITPLKPLTGGGFAQDLSALSGGN